MTRSIIALLSGLLAFGSASAGEREAEAFNRVAQGALLIDVRTPAEFSGGHLPGAINIPHPQIVTALQQRQIATDQNIVVYCRSGNRSGIAQKMLQQAGYNDVFNGGGFNALQRQAQQ